MKITDLMLRDWVTYESAPSQVIMVALEGVVMIVREEQIIYTNSERLNPIPLTKEMLEPNNIMEYKDEGCHSFIYKIDKYPMLEIFDWKHMGLRVEFDNTFKELKYVHELQHILRLIGLTELANNFKIK